MATVVYFSEPHIRAVDEAQRADTQLQGIIEQREIVRMAREDVEKRPGAYKLNLILQQEKQKLERLLAARWSRFGLVE